MFNASVSFKNFMGDSADRPLDAVLIEDDLRHHEATKKPSPLGMEKAVRKWSCTVAPLSSLAGLGLKVRKNIQAKGGGCQV
jgi:hypothetical protein